MDNEDTIIGGGLMNYLSPTSAIIGMVISLVLTIIIYIYVDSWWAIGLTIIIGAGVTLLLGVAAFYLWRAQSVMSYGQNIAQQGQNYMQKGKNAYNMLKNNGPMYGPMYGPMNGPTNGSTNSHMYGPTNSHMYNSTYGPSYGPPSGPPSNILPYSIKPINPPVPQYNRQQYASN